MSVLDELSKLEKDVQARMKELRPLLDEYAALEAAAKRLGLTDAQTDESPSRSAGSTRRANAKPRRAATASKPAEPAATEGADAAPKASPARSRAKSSKSKKQGSSPKPTAVEKSRTSAAATTKAKRQPGGSRSGQRADQLAALVKKRPGLTVKDASVEFGVHPTALYKVVKQLESDGKLTKRGRELHPV